MTKPLDQYVAGGMHRLACECADCTRKRARLGALADRLAEHRRRRAHLCVSHVSDRMCGHGVCAPTPIHCIPWEA
jgi:hypothetical protein